MKSFIFAAALVLSGTAFAQSKQPPGDGVTQQGTNPDGQACTPAGFNQGTTGYAPCGAMPGNQMSSTSPPPCSRTVTDGCIQTYERGVRPR